MEPISEFNSWLFDSVRNNPVLILPIEVDADIPVTTITFPVAPKEEVPVNANVVLFGSLPTAVEPVLPVKDFIILVLDRPDIPNPVLPVNDIVIEVCSLPTETTPTTFDDGIVIEVCSLPTAVEPVLPVKDFTIECEENDCTNPVAVFVVNIKDNDLDTDETLVDPVLPVSDLVTE